MKKYLLVIVLLLSWMAAACQATGSGGGQPTQAPASSPEGGSYPAPPTPYPGAPDVTGAPSGEALYPWLESGTDIVWEQAVAMILNGEVSQVAQSHDLTVQLMLKDGRSLSTTEPAIDEVMRVIESCGAPCQDIQIATE
jgi:hypothetical protein